MSHTQLGLLIGLGLGIAAAAGGFSGFLIALVLAVVGGAAGAQLEGRVDLPELLRGRTRG